MKRIVSALDEDQTIALEHDLLRRSDLIVHSVTTIEELLVAARESAQLCLVGPLLPDGDARDALEAVHADRDLTDMPVVLVATPEIAARVGSEGFAAVLSLPLTEPLDERLSVLLAATPRLSRRRRGFARVRDREEQPLGHAIDFAENGVLLRTRKPATVGMDLVVSITFPGATAPLPGNARVVRVNGERVALAFQEPNAALRGALADATGHLPDATTGLSFQPREALGARGVELAGTLLEGPALAALFAHVEGPTEPVRLRARDLGRFDDAALDRFLALLAAAGAPVELCSCPAWLGELCARMPSLSRRVQITSLWVAVRCTDCGDRFEDLAAIGACNRAAADTALASLTQPACLVCGGKLALIQAADALLAFVA